MSYLLLSHLLCFVPRVGFFFVSFSSVSVAVSVLFFRFAQIYYFLMIRVSNTKQLVSEMLVHTILYINNIGTFFTFVESVKSHFCVGKRTIWLLLYLSLSLGLNQFKAIAYLPTSYGCAGLCQFTMRNAHNYFMRIQILQIFQIEIYWIAIFEMLNRWRFSKQKKPFCQRMLHFVWKCII